MNFAESPLTQLNMATLVSAFMTTIFVSYLLAYFNREEYDLLPVSKKYAIYAMPFFLVFWLLQVPFILLIGIYLAGFVILMFRSNHYFQKIIYKGEE